MIAVGQERVQDWEKIPCSFGATFQMLQANFEFRPQFLAATLQFLGQSPTEYRQKLLG